jgi:hypothetical protein
MNYELEQLITAIANDKIDEQTGRALIGQMIDLGIQVKRVTRNLYDVALTPMGTVANSAPAPVEAAPAQPEAEAPASPTEGAAEVPAA